MKIDKKALELWGFRIGKAVTAVTSGLFVVSAAYIGTVGIMYYMEHRYIEGLLQALVGITVAIAIAAISVKIINAPNSDDLDASLIWLFTIVALVYMTAMSTLLMLYPTLYVWNGMYRIGKQ
jgi:chromate transport protein ChrA